jgi:hypothetical protein
MTFDEMRMDYIVRRQGVPALPITGCINYSAAAVASLAVPAAHANLVLTICFWAIMPVAALIGRLRGESAMTNPANPLFQLGAMARLMVLATWAIHIPVWIHAPSLFPLTVGIAFGLHWVIFSWSIGHPVGLIHLGIRTPLVLAAWFLVPGNRMGAVAAAVAISYMISVWQLSRIPWHELARRDASAQR